MDFICNGKGGLPLMGRGRKIVNQRRSEKQHCVGFIKYKLKLQSVLCTENTANLTLTIVHISSINCARQLGEYRGLIFLLI